MKISKDIAEDLMYHECPEGFFIVLREHLETTRWGNKYRVVFNHVDKSYELVYEIGSGDSEYDSADDWGNEVEVFEVKPREVKKIVWERV